MSKEDTSRSRSPCNPRISDLKKQRVGERTKIVQQNGLCVNCLRAGHSVADCLFGPCRQCPQKHNSLLHTNENDSSTRVLPDKVQESVSLSSTLGSQLTNANGPHTQSKTLGLGWLSASDELHFTTKLSLDSESKLTKRSILSVLSQIYDPLGLLAPAVIQAKILLQQLWLLKIGWDDAVPDDVVSMWNSFLSTLGTLNEIKIDRWISSDNTEVRELHVFSDASQKAYGACAYIRSCNSTIVMGWLRMSPHLLKTFVQNRVTEINELTDNGRNFVGVETQFPLLCEKNKRKVIDHSANQGIQFHFIPPYSGGLWEAGVKSCKSHLRRIVGDARLTFEEFSTVLAQIEAVLNSRPLSADPNDLSPLMPGHFLIGRPLTAPPAEDLTAAVTNRLNRYDRVEQLRQHFWRRWSKEFVSELQTRTKWKINHDTLTMNSLVLIKEDNLPPLRWRLGRIVQLFPGTDGVARVADIRTATGVVRRAFSKIWPLPLQPEPSSSSSPASPTITT
ncbi:unnamed protein product [Plutella xylostella]|uniref:(diamondback moth) hypothetical protein n=1 Tax=Plutella xylostella TaxID=51655 RepID=A0A8S4DIK2_PLUXY|nr:unnamed protein product [Plutella xylostella]